MRGEPTEWLADTIAAHEGLLLADAELVAQAVDDQLLGTDESLP